MVKHHQIYFGVLFHKKAEFNRCVFSNVDFIVVTANMAIYVSVAKILEIASERSRRKIATTNKRCHFYQIIAISQLNHFLLEFAKDPPKRKFDQNSPS